MKMDKQFFKKYQKPILWLANSFLGKIVFQFEKMGHELRKGEKIDRITPNSICYKNKDNSYTEQFFGRNEYALKLSPFLWWLSIVAWQREKEIVLRPAWQLVLIALFLKLPRGLPLLGLTTTDFYPDATTGNTTISGSVYHHQDNQTWSTIVGGGGNGSTDSEGSMFVFRATAGTNSNTFVNCNRGIALFDTSVITDDNVILSAVLNLYGNQRINNLNASPVLNIYSSNPAQNNDLTGTDYATLGSTAFCDTGIAYADFDYGGYNTFTLNTPGIAAISKTGITKLGMRDSYHDVGNVAPPWLTGWKVTSLRINSAYGATDKPKLTVTYEAAPVTDNSVLLGCNF